MKLRSSKATVKLPNASKHNGEGILPESSTEHASLHNEVNYNLRPRNEINYNLRNLQDAAFNSIKSAQPSITAKKRVGYYEVRARLIYLFRNTLP